MEEAANKIDWAHLPVRHTSTRLGEIQIYGDESLTSGVRNKAPVFTLVRESCSSLVNPTNPYVTISLEALSTFVSELDHTKLQSLPKKQYPLIFPSAASEINFITTLALLQIGSGWRVPLHAQQGGKGKGAAETMTFGVIGMHISGEITADTMLALGLFETAQLFGLKIQEEYEIQPGVSWTVKGDHTLACRDFSEFFHKFCKPPKIQEVDAITNQPPPLSVGPMVTRLVRHFKWLQDAYILEPSKSTPIAAASTSTEESKDASSTTTSTSSTATSSSTSSLRIIYLLKKVQLIVADLFLRFHDDPELSSLFGFHDIHQLTVFSDNVLPAVLRAKGILKYSDQLASIVDGKKLLTNREMEASLRAAAVVACERIVKEYNDAAGVPNALTAMSLDYHLWLLGKNEEFRSLTRHATYSGYY